MLAAFGVDGLPSTSPRGGCPRPPRDRASPWRVDDDDAGGATLEDDEPEDPHVYVPRDAAVASTPKKLANPTDFALSRAHLASPSPSPPTSANSATTTTTTTTVAHRDHPRPDPHPNPPARRPRRASAISPSLLARTPSVSVSWRLSTKPSPAPWRSTPRPVRRSARRLNPGSPRLVSPNPESPRLVSPPIASPLVPRLVLRRRVDPRGAEAARTCRDSNAAAVARRGAPPPNPGGTRGGEATTRT